MPQLEKIGQGRTAAIYRDGDRAIKVYTHTALDEVQREAQRQSFAIREGLPVPAIYGVEQMQGGAALTMQYIRGTALLRHGMDRLGDKLTGQENRFLLKVLRAHGYDV